MRQLKKAYILNLCIVCLEILSVGWMFSGLRIPGTGSGAALSASRFAILRYFTVDSNILMGIVALIVLLDLRKIAKGELEALPRKDYVLALMGTVGVTLTMLVTVFYLAPTIDNGWFVCFNNSNLFLHVINPLFSIVAFLFYERTNRLSLKDAFWGLLPMCVYAVPYIAVCIINSKDGRVLPGYDIYGFFGFGLLSGFIVFPIILVFTFGISACLFLLNRIKYSFNENISNEADLQALIKSQQGEIDAVLMYQRIADKIADQKTKDEILQTATDEGRHGAVFRELTGVLLKPRKTKAILVPCLMSVIGKRRTFKLIAGQEYAAESKYEEIVTKYPSVVAVQKDEHMHGDRMMDISNRYQKGE